MNRNTELKNLYAPTTSIQRSRFPMSQNIKTTFNMGSLIPFYVDADIYPGDTMQYKFSCVIRQTTSLNPSMDNAWADIYFVAVPWRLTWDSTKQFFGENKTGAWYQATEKVIPQLETPTGGAQKGTIMDYCGIPLGIAGLKFSALPIRAITLTYNELFRDQNLIAPATEYTDDTDRTASNTTSELGGTPYKVAKLHDYFTTCLPGAQKGQPVTIPVGSSSAPVSVFGDGKVLGITDGTSLGVIYRHASDGWLSGTSQTNKTLGSATDNTNTTYFGNNKGFGLTSDASKSGIIGIADLSSAFSATINAQRMAYQTQKILEKDARGGTRYTEIIQNHFLTTSPDARLQRPEYLGGKRIPINMTAVPQTSSTDSTSPQGNLSAYSHTIDSDFMFTKSFTEHTIILGFICVRQQHSYNQGLARQWSRRRRLDCYFPALAHLGEQAILNKEIYCQGPSAININTGLAYDEETFGFQERWAELRQKNNLITGAFRTTYAQSLDFWHYGDDYSSLPVLSQNFIEETPDFLDRTLAVAHTTEDQYLMDAEVSIMATRPMPLHSVPGLVDHF